MMDRREFLAALGAATVIGPAAAHAHYKENYKVPAGHRPVEVKIREKFRPGEIHVDPNNFRLYWTKPGNRATRYVIGVGKPGRYIPGTFRVGRKAEWPTWTPTRNMIRREPHIYSKYAGGMAGGPNNPLGSRALYLYRGSRDSLLRIHGTPHPWTIDGAVSNGCARMINQHVEALYEIVPIGTRVVLHPKNS